MTNLVETVGPVEIYIDFEPESPREWDNLGTFWTYESRYHSPDPNPEPSPPSDAIVLPVYRYEHSGVCYRTSPFSCPWDSGQVGWIFAPRERVRQEFGVKRISRNLRKKVESILSSEVDIYSEYANGEVYGFVNTETGDSCWGFFGSDREHMLQEALQ